MKHFTIVGNWKMYQNPEQALRLVERLQSKIKPHTHVTNVICPPVLDLVTLKGKLEPDLFKLGAQDLNEFDEGAYTGEVSGAMLKGLVDYVIIGHSERRHYEGETDKRIAKKVAAAVRNGITPILCIGEKAADREDGHSQRVVADQLHGCLSQVSADDIRKLIITYEPVWAISSNPGAKPDTPADVEPMVAAIRQTIEAMFGEGASSDVKILYGGSANPDNAKAFLSLEHVDGLLVGHASLNYDQFASIIDTAAQLADGR